MPSTIVTIKRLLAFFCLCLFLWLIFISSKSDTEIGPKKYKSKHNYSNFYKKKKSDIKTPDEDGGKPVMLRDYSKSPRDDLKPKLVYRGTDEEIDPNDIGLVKNTEDKKIRDDGYKKFAYNSLVSKRLGFHRDINDTRHKQCLNKTFSEKLPTASVIICFFNEDFYTLMRSVYSVVRRSPRNLIKEIILINDHSDDDSIIESVQSELNVATELSAVRLLTPPQRLGLIRARIFGARKASGDVLVFLDSHVEANVQWLEPLMSRIEESRTNVVTPIIDIINPDSFTYGPSPLVRGGFNWGLNFKWESLPHRVEVFDKPILSPTMAGGLFAMDRKYFEELGEYDSGLDIWGGENLEISFRIWMCGGRLDIIPCSRVGHVFRKRRPYTSTSKSGVDTQTRNALRVAKVWLGDYIKHFYATATGVEAMDAGNITDRVKLREELKCKDFAWYHKNIYPELEVPGQPSNKKASEKVQNLQKYERWDQRSRNYTGSFQMKHIPSSLCVEPVESVTAKGSRLKLSTCLRSKKQSWYTTDRFELVVARLLCMDAGKGDVRLMKCHEMKGQQEWHTKGGRGEGVTVYNPAAGQCVVVQDPGLISMAICSEQDTAVWKLVSLD